MDPLPHLPPPDGRPGPSCTGSRPLNWTGFPAGIPTLRGPSPRYTGTTPVKSRRTAGKGPHKGISPAHRCASVLCRRALPANCRNSAAALAPQSHTGRRTTTRNQSPQWVRTTGGTSSWDALSGFAGINPGGAGGAALLRRGGITPARTISRPFANGVGAGAVNKSARRTGTPARPLGRLLREARFPQQAARGGLIGLGGVFHFPPGVSCNAAGASPLHGCPCPPPYPQFSSDAPSLSTGLSSCCMARSISCRSAPSSGSSLEDDSGSMSLRRYSRARS